MMPSDAGYIHQITRNSSQIKIAARNEERALKGITKHIIDELKDLQMVLKAHANDYGKLDSKTRLVALRQKVIRLMQTVDKLHKLHGLGNPNLEGMATIGDAMHTRLDMFKQALEQGHIESSVQAMQQFHFIVNELERDLESHVSKEIKVKDQIIRVA